VGGVRALCRGVRANLESKVDKIGEDAGNRGERKKSKMGRMRAKMGRTMASVSSSARRYPSSSSEISVEEMMSGGEQAIESPTARTMTPWCRALSQK